jgi:hypothetical protein
MRVTPLQLIVATAALAGGVTWAATWLRSPPTATGTVEKKTAESPRAEAARLQRRPLPRFEIVESPVPALPSPALMAVPAQPPPPAPPPNPQAELQARGAKDGFVFRETGSQAIYLVRNGAKIRVPTEAALQALGHRLPQVEVVPAGWSSSLPDRPPEPPVSDDGGGARRPRASGALFEKLGRKP